MVSKLQDALKLEDLNSLVTLVPSLKASVSTLSVDLLNCESSLAGKTQANELLERDVLSLKKEKRSTDGNLENLAAENGALRDEIQSWEKTLEVKLKRLETEYANEMSQKSEAAERDMKEKMMGMERKIHATYKVDMEASGVTLNELTHELKSTKTDLVKKNIDLDQCRQHKIELSAKVAELEKNSHAERQERMEEKASLEKMVADLREQRMEKESECKTFRDAEETVVGKLDYLEKLMSNTEKYYKEDGNADNGAVAEESKIAEAATPLMDSSNTFGRLPTVNENNVQSSQTSSPTKKRRHPSAGIAIM